MNKTMYTNEISVLMDGRMFAGRFAGVSRVVAKLAQTIASRPGVRVQMLCGDGAMLPLELRGLVDVVRCDFTRGHLAPARRWSWEQRHLPRILRESGANLYHATWNSGVPAHCPVASVLTIHDLIPWNEQRSGISGWLTSAAYRKAAQASARHATIVTTVSETTRGEVISTLALPPEKVITVHNGADGLGVLANDASGAPREESAAAPLHAAHAGTLYVLYVGGHELRKNVAGVFRAMEQLWRRLDHPIELRLTGSRERLDGEADAVMGRLSHPDRVRFLGDVPDDRLVPLYREAACVITMTLAEGFGLPVLEAMSLGCPVVCSDLPVFRELAGAAALMVDPRHPPDAAQAIHQLLSEPDLRASLIDAGLRRAADLPWSAAADKMLAIYYRAIRGRIENTASAEQPAAAGANVD